MLFWGRACALLVAVAGCAPSSLVFLDGDTALRGELIEDPDLETLVIDQGGEHVRLQRSAVRHVQLPGQAYIITGAVMMDMYLLVTVATMVPILRYEEDCAGDLECEGDGFEGAGIALAGASPLIIGGAIAFLYGIAARVRSRNRLDLDDRPIGGPRQSRLQRALSIFGPTGMAFDLSL